MAPLATATAQFLRVSSDIGIVHRWQSRWPGQSVAYANTTWEWHPFSSAGLVAGNTGTEQEMTIDIPSTSVSLPVMRGALKLGSLAEIIICEFDPALGVDGPPPVMAVVGSYIGQVVRLTGFQTLSVSLGSALSPVGVQFPPRAFSSFLIGVPCEL
jgi:hypothetical protein